MTDDTVRAPQALREEEAFLSLAETLSALVALIQGDKLIYVNPAGAAILGYPQAYYKGRNFWEFALPEEREMIIARGRSRQRGVEHPRRFTERLRHADGHILWVDYSVDVIQLNGKTTTLLTGHDITEQKRAEENLRKSEALFRGLFLQSPVMMCSVDQNDNFREVSDYWLKKLGYERHELIGKNAWAHLPEESLKRFGAIIEQKRRDRDWSCKDVPLQVYRKDGTTMDILLSSVAELDDRGEPIGWITVAQDLSEIKLTQQALSRSEERFRAAFQHAAIGKTIIGADLRFIQVNQAFCDMLGRTEAEILGKTPRDFTHPDDVLQGRLFVDHILSGEVESARQFKRYLHRSGRIVWVDMTSTLVRDERGNPSYFVTEIQDISDRKEAEQLLRASEERFRAAFANAAIGKTITGPDLHFIQVNRAFCEMLGYAEHELLQKTPLSLSHEDDLAEGRALVARLISGEATSGRMTKRYRHKKGHWIWGDLTTSLERSATGQPLYFITEIVDVTERKRAEELLRDREAKLAEAQRIALLGSWEHDLATNTSTWSEEFYRIYGLDPAMKNPTKEDFFSFLHPDDRDRVMGIVQQAIREGNPYEYEARIVLGKGRVRWLHAIARVDKDASGKPTRLYGVAQDITERKEAEELLKDREAKLAESQRIAKIGRWEWDVDKNLVVWSEEMYRIFGLKPEEFEGTKEAVFSRIHEVDRARIASQVAGSVEDGKPHEQEYRAVRPNGEIRHVWATNQSVLDASGRVVRMFGVARDITERKQAEELVWDREAKLAEAQRVAHLGNWEYDIATNTSTWSEEMYRIFGADPKTFNPSKENAFERFHPDDLPRVAKIVEKALQDGQPFEYDSRVVHGNGEVRTLHTIGRAHLDARGKPVRLYGIAQDVTERVKAEALLRDREAMLEEAQHIAHLGSWEIDLVTRHVTMSDELHRIYAVDPARFVSSFENIVARIHPEDRAPAISAFETAAAKQASFEVEHRVVHDDGGIRNLWVRGRIGVDAAGRPVKMYGVAQDITERKLAMNLLRDREAGLAEAQRIAHIGSWDWDVVRGTVVWTDELFRILGLDPATSKATFDGYMLRVHPDDRPSTLQRVNQGVEDGQPFESEHRIIRDDGEVRAVWTSCRMDRDASGKVVRMYGIAQDITDRKRAEEALRTSEQRFRSLYTQAPVMMTAMTADGRIREVSNYWLKLMGYERHEVIGADGFRFITADSRVILEQALAQALSSGDLVLRNLPMVGVRKDGSKIDVLVTSVIELDEEGQPFGSIVVGIDVSDIRRAEEAIRESEARYRALVENAPEAIVVLDVETGKFIDGNANAELLFGYSREKFLSMGPLDFCPKLQAGGMSSHDVAWEQIGRVMRGESPVFEFVHTHASGREIPCQIRLSRLPATGQNLVRATLTDISELKAMEEKVRHAEKMAAIGLLAAGVAHEIGNPLLAMSMAAQSLERKSTDEYAQKKLGLIREHIERISKIVRQMSDLARPQSLQKTSCDVNRVLERTLEVVRYDKRAKEVPITFRPCPDVPFVQAVEDQLTQVCLNLALNALDAVAMNPPDRPRTLHIEAKCVKRDGRSFVRAAFKDSGPGIPEAQRSKIFQPFFTTKSAGKGTGLGLSVSYRIIEEHRGTLAFDCGPSGGTEFYFELPVQERT